MGVLRKAFVFTVCSLAWTTVAQAQSSLQVPMQFDFLNPGARSLSLGSAFTAVADDATAAFTNPAGLVLLSRPEVSFEGRGRRTVSPFLFGGRLSGPVSNQGVDTDNGAIFRDSIDSGFGASFISFVYPRGNWAVSAHRHELLRVNQSYRSQGVFQRIIFSGQPTDIRELPQIGLRELSMTSYTGAFAYKVSPMVSVGVSVSLYDFSLSDDFRRYLTSAFFAAPDYTREFARAAQAGDATGAAFNVGLLVSPSSNVRVGASYKQGPSFDFISQSSSTLREGTFNAPDTFSVGAMVRPSEVLTVSVDYSRIKYSALREDYVVLQAIESTRADQFVIDDGNEFHAGAEYVFAMKKFAPAVRVGTWYDPAHGVRYEPLQNDSFDERFSVALPGGDSLMHITGGVGLSLSQKLEINAAGDFTSKRQLYSGSLVFRF